jgi:DNA-binding transcriptional MerR regulator
MIMDYTVRQLADLAGVSRRTLHYYDEVGLLKPSKQGRNRYRYYNDAAVLRLQQILFYRELGLSLNEIKDILRQPDFDVLTALEEHRSELEKRVARLNRLIATVDKTILHLNGGISMSKKEIFEAFSDEQVEKYAEEARQRWDPNVVNQSMKLWNSYSDEKKKAIIAEGEANYQEIFDHMEKGHASPEVQAGVAKWHQHMRYFYKPSLETLKGLGQMYCHDARFRTNFEKFSPEFPEFLCEAIQFYCQGKGE